MIECKKLEIRDRGTTIPVMAIRVIGDNPYDMSFMIHSGFSTDYPDVFLMRYDEVCECNYDPFKWQSGARTLKEAHFWIRENYDLIKDYDVVDVEYILGESTKPKISEIWQG